MKKYSLVFSFLAVSLLSACSTVPNPDPIDPWEGMNRDIMAFNDEVDRLMLKPAAEGYQWITPEFVDIGITNFFANVRDVGVTINDLLQAKFVHSAMDAGRFLVNTTVGVAGFVDVASHINLPKHNEDFAQTLAVWGVPRGPYVVMPFYGPSSVRGIGGRVGDMALNPLTYTGIFGDAAMSWASFGSRTVDLIDIRADLLSVEAVASEAAIDRYTFFRSAYIQRRDYLISDGQAAPLKLDDLEDDGSLYKDLE